MRYKFITNGLSTMIDRIYDTPQGCTLMLVSSNDLYYFTEICNTLNFSRASERIGISQPSLSIAIKRLENIIGTRLFNRNKNGVQMTHAGRRLLSHAKALLQMWETVKSESLASHNEIQGNFSLGVHPSVALHSLSQFLPKILVQHPKLDVQLKHDLSRKILEGIINLSIDLGIVVNPIRHPDLIIQKLYDDKVTFWHAKKHHSIESLSLKDSILIGDPDLMQTQWLLKSLNRQRLKFNRFITSNNLEVIANLTANHAGIGILPTKVALYHHAGMLHAIPKAPVYNDEICLVYRHENRDIKGLQVIINAIKFHLKNKGDAAN